MSRNLSASQVKTHSKCPMQYWLQYVQGRERTKYESRYLKLGNRVHEAIEAVLKDIDVTNIENERALSEIVVTEYERRDGPALDKEMYETGVECCEAAARRLYDQQPVIRGVEERVEFGIDRPDIETGVTAIMDVTTEGEVWDWKTGRIREDTKHDERIQGATYMAAYYHLYGEEPERIQFVYLKEGRFRTIDPSDENWMYLLRNAKALLHAKKTGEFPAKPGENCYWCGVEGWCSESPVGMGGVQWDEY